MKRLFTSIPGQLTLMAVMLCAAVWAATVRAAEQRSMFYNVAIGDYPSAREHDTGYGRVFCDTTAGKLIYALPRGGESVYSVVQSNICTASGGTVTFPYDVPYDGKVYCDTAADMLIYVFTDQNFIGTRGNQYIVVPAPDICH